MSLTLHVCLLGDFRLTYGDQPITSVEMKRVQSLLACMVLRPGELQSRQRLSFSFWPNSTERQARTNLRQLLYHLRRALPDADRFLEVGDQTITWARDAPYTLDVADFERALEQPAGSEPHHTAARTALEQAIQIYRGDLFPGCYDD